MQTGQTSTATLLIEYGADLKITVRKEEERFSRHSDLKPENILWSDESALADLGIFKFADQKPGRFHRLESRSGVDSKVASRPST
jgi:serine/threonine protein kinase